MNTFNLLSAVQIVLESIPVSSSGNVTLLMNFLPRLFFLKELPVVSEQFLFFLHGPTILVVGIFFFRRWINYVIGFLKRESAILSLIFFGFVANIITVFFYLLHSHYSFFAGFEVPLWIGFLITTLLLFSTRLPWISCCALDNECEYNVSDSINKNQNYGIIKPLRHGIILGLAQSAALFVPGISRLASTFVVGRWLGWAPLIALEYSFLIEFPLICAGFLKGVWWVVKTSESYQIITASFIITIALSTLLAYAALVFVARCAKNNKIWLFGFYTGLLSIISFVL